MDSINIATELDTTAKEDNTCSNGRPTNLVSQHPTMPLSPIRLDNINDQHFESISSPRREEFSNLEVPTMETTMNQPPPPPHEEKKTRWGLGRKLREKKDKK